MADRLIALITDHPHEFQQVLQCQEKLLYALLDELFFRVHPQRCFLLELNSQLLRLIFEFLYFHELTASLSATCKDMRCKVNRLGNRRIMNVSCMSKAPSHYLRCVRELICDRRLDGLIPDLPLLQVVRITGSGDHAVGLLSYLSKLGSRITVITDLFVPPYFDNGSPRPLILPTQSHASHANDIRHDCIVLGIEDDSRVDWNRYPNVKIVTIMEGASPILDIPTTVGLVQLFDDDNGENHDWRRTFLKRFTGHGLSMRLIRFEEDLLNCLPEPDRIRHLRLHANEVYDLTRFRKLSRVFFSYYTARPCLPRLPPSIVELELFWADLTVAQTTLELYVDYVFRQCPLLKSFKMDADVNNARLEEKLCRQYPNVQFDLSLRQYTWLELSQSI